MRRKSKAWGLALAAMASLGAATPAAAGEVWVVVNGITGEIVVGGNAPDSPDWVRQNSVQRVPDGWDQLFGDDAKGWAAVGCVVRPDGTYYFEIATGHPSEARARELARAAAEQYISRYAPEARLVPGCGYAWNNDGSTIALGPSPARPMP